MNSQINKIIQKIDNFKESELYFELELIKEKNALNDLLNQLNSHKFKIGVIGEFSTGKSTLINSILGRELLPASFIPTTNQVTYIKGSDSNYVQITNDNSSKTNLTSENILELSNNKENKSIDIFINNSFMEDYTIIDTPGTNDPSKFSDEIVFDLIGSVDIVIFNMKIDQALKQTEIEFISQLIKKKDIEKFFFVMNFSDEVNEPIHIKNEIISKLTSILNLDHELIKNHTFILSAKNSLEAKLSGNNEELDYTGLNILLENIESYIKHNKMNLLNDMADLELKKILNNIYLKVQTTIDKLDGNDKLYNEQLEVLSKNIDEFKSDIEVQTLEFNKDLNDIKNNYKKDVKDIFEKIKDEIKDEIKESKLEKFVGTRYLELRTKKLIEDSIEDCTKTFTKEVEKIVTNFDSSLESVFSDRIVKIDSALQTNIGKNAVNVGSIVGVGALGFAGYSAVAATVTTIGAEIAAIPVVGSYLVGLVGAGAAGAAGVGLFFAAPFLLPIGKIVFDVGKWGVGKIGDAAAVAEEKILKEKYILDVKSSIDKVLKTVIENIEKIESTNFIDNYIENKFPQKKVLEKKIQLIEEKKEKKKIESNLDKDMLLSFQNSLHEVI